MGSPARRAAVVCSPITWARIHRRRRRLQISVGVEVGPQAASLVPELGGRTRRRCRGPRRQVRRSVVGIDEAVDMATERQPEREIALDDRSRVAHPKWAWRNSSVRTQAVRASSSSYEPIGLSSLANV